MEVGLHLGEFDVFDTQLIHVYAADYHDVLKTSKNLLIRKFDFTLSLLIYFIFPTANLVSMHLPPKIITIYHTLFSEFC